MIKAKCHTNVDDYDTSKVHEFVALPRIGEKVVVTYKGKLRKMKISSITHDHDGTNPFINVELIPYL